MTTTAARIKRDAVLVIPSTVLTALFTGGLFQLPPLKASATTYALREDPVFVQLRADLTQTQHDVVTHDSEYEKDKTDFKGQLEKLNKQVSDMALVVTRIDERLSGRH